VAIASTGSDVHYPESDGKPMAETTIHRDVMLELIVGLRDWFADDPLAYVSGNEFLYFVEGDPRRNVSPDVWVALGIDKDVIRPSYKTWEEGGKGPDLVVEVSSRSTRREDLKEKLALYRDELKVAEYFLFDPLGEYLKPPLRGYRLVHGEYEPIDPDGGRLPSVVLDLHLEAGGKQLRLFDALTGQRLPTRLEALEEKENELRRAQDEIQRKEFELHRRRSTIQQQGDTLEEIEVTIREQAVTIRERDLTIREKDLTLRQAAMEIDQLRRELDASRGGPPPAATPRPKKPRPKRK